MASAAEQLAANINFGAIAKAEELKQSVLASPVVKAAFDAFPDAELTHYDLNERSA